MESYDHKKIEKKWQAKWKKDGIYKTDLNKSGEKKYILVEFPYPSGNLHVGHWYAFAVPDIYVRKQKMEGKNVFFPFGFDSFGLPAENAAIKRGLDPRAWTYDNINHMTGQIESMGTSLDWSAKVVTSDENYYKWTQWLFLQLFKKGLVYRAKAEVNWCPSCNTVLANEQVITGHCERCDTEVEKRQMEQWMMRITKYAERLIEDLDSLDWPKEIKDSQKNWIGKSEGSELEFNISDRKETIKVFTTRADTTYGATYLVLAPEHKLITDLNKDVSNIDEINQYIQEAKKKTSIERSSESKEKTGVELKGIKAINPATKEEISIWVADYVLPEYGTGAIMAVPAHDTRDNEFAKKYNLPVVDVIKGDEDVEETYTGEGVMINSGEFDGLNSEKAKKKITEAVGGKLTTNYKLRDWLISRQRYWGVPIPIVYDKEGSPHPVPDEHLPWTLPEDVDIKPTGEAPLGSSKELKRRTEKIFGEGWRPEIDTMDTFVDSSWYFFRYLSPNNNEEFSLEAMQKKWLPVDMYSGGSEHTTMHLLYSRFFTKALFDLGLSSVNEPYKVRMNRGLIIGTDGNKMSKSKGNVVDPDVHVERVGADSVKMYLAFIAPFNEVGAHPWNTGGIAGIRRFLERVTRLVSATEETSQTLETALHKTIAKVETDINQFKFNTAISALMSFVNLAEKEGITSPQFEVLLKLLAPFAPHLTEELWESLGHTTSIHLEHWPEYKSELLKDTELIIAVQVNSKVRDNIQIKSGSSEEDVTKKAIESTKIQKWLDGKTPKRVVYVEGRLINLIV